MSCPTRFLRRLLGVSGNLGSKSNAWQRLVQSEAVPLRNSSKTRAGFMLLHLSDLMYVFSGEMLTVVLAKKNLNGLLYQIAFSRINLKRSLAVAACLPRQCNQTVSPSVKEGHDLSLMVRQICTDGLASPPVRYCLFERKLVSGHQQRVSPCMHCENCGFPSRKKPSRSDNINAYRQIPMLEKVLVGGGLTYFTS